MFLAPPSAGVAARHWARHFSRPCPIPETFPAKEAARHRPSQLLFSRTLSEPPRSSTSRFGLSNRIFGVVFTTLFNQAPPRKVSSQLCDLWTPGRSNRILGTVLVISIQSNGIPTTVSAVSIQLERLRWNPPIVPLSDFSSVEGSAKIDDLYSVEQAEDTIIPTIVLSNTSPKLQTLRRRYCETACSYNSFRHRSKFSTIFLPSGFRASRPAATSSTLRVVFADLTAIDQQQQVDAFFRVEHLLHRRYFFFDFPGSIRKLGSITSNKWTTYSGSNTTSPPQGLPLPLSGVLFENSVHHYQQADPLFWFEHHFPTASDFFFHFPGGFQSPTLPHRRRLLLPLSGVCSRPSITSRTHSDFFFFHFLGFVRKLTPITITNKWTTSSGSNTSSRSPATSSSTFRGFFANSVPSPASKTAKHPPRWLSTTLPSRRPPSPGPTISTPSIFPRALARMVTGTSPSLVVKT